MPSTHSDRCRELEGLRIEIENFIGVFFLLGGRIISIIRRHCSNKRLKNEYEKWEENGYTNKINEVYVQSAAVKFGKVS